MSFRADFKTIASRYPLVSSILLSACSAAEPKHDRNNDNNCRCQPGRTVSWQANFVPKKDGANWLVIKHADDRPENRAPHCAEPANEQDTEVDDRLRKPEVPKHGRCDQTVECAAAPPVTPAIEQPMPKASSCSGNRFTPVAACCALIIADANEGPPGARPGQIVAEKYGQNHDEHNQIKLAAGVRYVEGAEL